VRKDVHVERQTLELFLDPIFCGRELKGAYAELQGKKLDDILTVLSVPECDRVGYVVPKQCLIALKATKLKIKGEEVSLP
jgi:hypothetical protein